MRRALCITLLLFTACDGPEVDRPDAAALSDAAADAALDAGSDGGGAPLEDLVMDEETQLTLTVPGGEGARVFVEGAPAGSVFDEPSRALHLAPDFTQSGEYVIRVDVVEGAAETSESFTLTVRDTIQPPDPVVTGEMEIWGARILHLELTSDDFLDPPGLAGRTFEANVVVPDAASAENLLPVSIGLHGSGGSPGTGGGGRERFSIAPSEPYVSWWTGQHASAPEEASAGDVVANTSQRRILHLLDWLTRTHPGVDRERVTVSGTSMGGSGAVFFAIRYGYHLAAVSSALGMTALPLASEGKRRSMESHWGPASLDLRDDRGMSIWERYDLTRALADDPWVRDVFFTTDSGVTDGIVTFHHITSPSPLTAESWAEAARRLRVGHRIVWDQRGHQTNEGGFVGRWAGSLPAESELRRDRPFPAFGRSSIDDDPPTWDEAAGEFTGGDPRGARNRYLAWVTADAVDARARLELPLFVRTEPPAEPYADGYPDVGDGYPGPLPITADVTPRRVRNFRCLPGESVRWSFGELSGEVEADADGAVTVPALPLGAEPVPLILTRE